MKKLTSFLAGVVLLFFSANSLYAGNKFGLPNFEEMKPQTEAHRRSDGLEIFRTSYDYDKPVLFRTFNQGYVVVSVDCPHNGKIKRFEMFVRDRKQNKAFERDQYSIFRRLKEVSYDTQIDATGQDLGE